MKRRARLHPSLVTEVVSDLTQRGTRARAVVEDEPLDVLWPTAHGTDEYLVPRVDPAFVVTEGDRRETVRTLDRALPGHAATGDRPADDFDRLELVRLTALLISSLHDQELVTAGVGWETFAFRLEPRPEVVFHLPDRIRRIGGEFLQPPIEPRPAGWSNSPFDSDRGDFAILAFRLLVALEVEADLEPQIVERVPGTSPEQTAVLQRLWERAAGPVGSRPQLVEWLEAFGVGNPSTRNGVR